YTGFLICVSMFCHFNGRIFASIETISSFFFAVWLFNEQFYAIYFVGMLFILVAVWLISLIDMLVAQYSIG
ncbi:EamA family transporter, partial [Streptococcus suis]